MRAADHDSDAQSAAPKPLHPTLEALTFHDVTSQTTRLANWATRAVGFAAVLWSQRPLSFIAGRANISPSNAP
jgi:hypothetical protein